MADAGPTRAHRIALEAEARLRGTGYAAFRCISCDVDGDAVILHGHLRSHHLKQVAQEAVRSIEGVRSVLNRIEVASPHVGLLRASSTLLVRRSNPG